MRPIEITTGSYSVADTDGLAAAQTLLAAGFVTLSATTLTPPRFVTISSVGNDSGVIFTVTGTSPEGHPQTENIAGGNVATVITTKTFATVTSVYSDGATANDITVGYTQSGYSQWIPLDIYTPNQVTCISADIAGTINYSVEYTNENPFSLSSKMAVAHPVAALTGAATDQTAFSTNLMRAVRYKVNSGDGTMKFTITQQSTL